MGRTYVAELPSGERAASTLVDLDGVQVRVRMFEGKDGTKAEVAFRRHPGEGWSEPVLLEAADDDESG